MERRYIEVNLIKNYFSNQTACEYTYISSFSILSFRHLSSIRKALPKDWLRVKVIVLLHIHIEIAGTVHGFIPETTSRITPIMNTHQCHCKIHYIIP